MLGGLGNQLFIYAAARRLALRNSVGLKLDITSGYREDFYKRNYCLNHFNIKAEIASKFESYDGFFGKGRQKFVALFSARLPFGKRKYIKHQFPHFDERLLNLRVNGKIYLDGLWQSEHYFKDEESVIHDDLKITTRPDPQNEDIAQKISAGNAVSLHTRRLRGVGNVKGGKPKDSVASLGFDYYQSAIKKIVSKVPKPHFFCFSDYPDWLRENLSIDYPVTFITHNKGDEKNPDAKNYEDLRLMSLCKHHIIANSTFSWWGAWLNPRKDKIVIAPRQGLGGLKNYSERAVEDSLPAAWIKI